MAYVFVIVLLFLAALFGTQMYFFGLSSMFWESVLINLMSSAIFIYLTVFILEKLIKKYYDKIETKIEKEKYLDVLSSKHDQLTNKLQTTFIHFLSKKPPEFTKPDLTVSINKFRNVLEKIDKYISDDFIIEEYEILVIDSSNIFQSRTIKIPYSKFCKHHFKDVYRNEISEFVSRYHSLIPNEILELLFKIEDTLQANVFTVPEDSGVNLNIRNIKIGEGFIKEYRENVKFIGDALLKLQKYSKTIDIK